MRRFARDQLPPPQILHGHLHHTFRKPRFLRDLAQACLHHTLPALRTRVQEKINQKGGRLLVMRDQITHQHIHNVRIEAQRRLPLHLKMH